MAKEQVYDAKTGMPLPLLANLPLEEGLRFGDWTVWGEADLPEAISLFLIHSTSGCVIHFPTSSNGWVNYQFPDMPDWYIVWSNATVDRQTRALAPEQFAGRPTLHDFPEGPYTSQDWGFDRKGDVLRIRYLTERCLTLRRNSPVWTCDTVGLPGVSSG